MTPEIAKARLKLDIQKARHRYGKRLAVIKGKRDRGAGNGVLSVRATQAILNNSLWKPADPNDDPDIVKTEHLAPEKVAKLSLYKLKKTPNCGAKTINEIRYWLSQHNLDLQP